MTPKEVIAKITITPELKNYIIKMNAKQLGQLRQSLCNLTGILNTDESALFTHAGVSADDVKTSASDLPSGYILGTPLYNILMYISIRAEQMGDLNMAYESAVLFSLITLGRLKYKYIRICNISTMTNTIGSMTKKTYVGTNGLVWMVYKVAQSTYDKYREALCADPNDMYARMRYIVDIRNKFNQIMKHIARLYYSTHLSHGSEAKNEITVKTISSVILTLIATQDIPNAVVDYIASLAKVQHSDVYNLHHFVQISASAQQYMDALITFLTKRIIELQSIGANQDVEVNEISPDLVKKLFGSFRRTTLGKIFAQDNIFATQNISEALVVAFVVVLVCFYWRHAQSGQIEQTDHPTEDNGLASVMEE